MIKILLIQLVKIHFLKKYNSHLIDIFKKSSKPIKKSTTKIYLSYISYYNF
jgi:hypothetical protein